MEIILGGIAIILIIGLAYYAIKAESEANKLAKYIKEKGL